MTATSPDPVMAAFLGTAAADAFSSVVFPNQVGMPDPFDVGDIHATARADFGLLVSRASSPKQSHGKSLLLLGEGGSGKTHLMRAFRHAVHGDRDGYCAYMQMTQRSDHYARYILRNVIVSLEQPYLGGRGPSGLMRLAQGLLDSVDVLSSEERNQLSDPTLDAEVAARLVHRIAALAVQHEKYLGVDIDLMRAVLFLLHQNTPLYKTVIKWLRCEKLQSFDEQLISITSRHTQDDPLPMLEGLGKLMFAVHEAPLVILVDQIEDTLEQDETAEQKGDTLRALVKALIDIQGRLPNSVVVLSCLAILYEIAKGRLTGPQIDRLEREPDKLTLSSKRTPAEIAAMVAVRLEAVFDGVARSHPLQPYTEADLRGLESFSSRDILNNLGRHRADCIQAGKWLPPKWAAEKVGPVGALPVALAQAWNEFLVGTSHAVLEDEQGLAELLAFSLNGVSAEMTNGARFAAEADRRYVPLEIRAPDGAVSKLSVAVCDRNARGGGLRAQLQEAAAEAAGRPSVIVRSTDFPKSGDALSLLAQMVRDGAGRKVVVLNADWRAMAAFRAFHAKQSQSPEYTAWRIADAPLGRLASLQAILQLDAVRSLPAAPTPPARAEPPPLPESLAPRPAPALIRLGVTRTANPAPVLLDPETLCRHMAFLGGSGSGKSTAALVVVEELLLRGVPAILLDRKGDLARYADPDAWDEPEPDAARADRRARLRAAIDVQLYTPGAAKGRPLAIPIAPADFADLPADDRHMAAKNAADGLAAMMGYNSKTPDPKVTILQQAVAVLARAPGRPVTPRALATLVKTMDDALLAESDGSFEEKHYAKLGEHLLSFAYQQAHLLEGGEALSVDALFGRGPSAVPGKTRLSIINTQALVASGEAASGFWVSQFLLTLDRWRAKNPSPGGKLQAVVLLDEADKYLPAGAAKPPTKAPAESLLKRARSAGLGLFLASQQPGDFDYKCRDQILTWLFGRIKETVAVEKVRPILDAGRRDAADKLPGLKTGDFYLARESDVLPITAERNAIPTLQLPESRILELAKACNPVTDEPPASR